MTTASIFLVPNGTFIIELVVSILLILAIYKWVLPPINKAIEERQEKIRVSLESADQARADAEAADDERRSVLEQARQQAREIVATANHTAEQVRTDAQARGQSEYERIVGNADVEIALARQRAVEEAAARMGEVVMEVVERIIGREVNADVHRDLIDQAVTALREEPDAAAAGAGAAVNPALQGYTAAVAEAAGSAALPAIAADLEAVEQVVLGSPQLRAALTDTTVSGPSRRAVMLDLLEGKISAEARRLAAYASGAVLAPEVPAALGWLAARVRHLTEGQDDEPSLSLMSSHRRVGGYAAAEHEGMSNDELESMEDDLFRFSRIVASTPALRAALTDRDLDVSARQGVVNQLLEGKVPDTTLRLVRYVVVGGRARDFVGTLDYLVEATAKARGWRIARVSAAQSIDDTQRNELSASLSTLAGGPVELQVQVDESLLSGARIVIGDLQVDATARGRLEALREHLTPAGWEPSGFGRRGQSSTDNTEGAN